MFCQNCGTRLADDAAFCANCGAPTGHQQPTQQPIPQQPTQQSIPQQPTQQSIPQQPTQQSIPQQPTQQSIPQQPTQQSIPQQPTQQSIPQQPTQQYATQQPTQQYAPQQPAQQYAQPAYQQPTYAQPVYPQQPAKRGHGKLIAALIGGVVVVAAVVVACILIFGGSGSKPLDEMVSALQKTIQSESFDCSLSTSQTESFNGATQTQNTNLDASLVLNLKKKTVSGEVDIDQRIESSWYGTQTASESGYLWNNTSLVKDGDGWYADQMDDDTADVLDEIVAIVKSDKPIEDLVDLIAASVAKKSEQDDFKDYVLEFYDRINSESWLEKNCEFERSEGKNGTTWTVELRSIRSLVNCIDSLSDILEKVGITEDEWEEMKDNASDKDGTLEFCLSWTIQDGYLTAIRLDFVLENLETGETDSSGTVTSGTIGNVAFSLSIEFDSIGEASCDLDEIEAYYQQAVNY